MVLFYQTCKNLFTSKVSSPGRNIFAHPMDVVVTKKTTTIAEAIYAVNMKLNAAQYNIVQKIHDLYSLMLATRKYDKIPTDYEQYLDLLANLQTIAVPNATLKMLLNIVEKTLVGCMNVVQIYESATYNELQILLLNNRIDEILSDKNSKNVIADEANITGNFAAKQSFKLSKFYSYYIYLYGMPEFGVGFDPAKLTFLKKALELFDQSHIEVPGDLLIPPRDASGNPIDASGREIIRDDDGMLDETPDLYPELYRESIFEIGYTMNFYEHMMYYQTIYPLGFYVVALLEVPPPAEVPEHLFNPDPKGAKTISYWSELAGFDVVGFDISDVMVRDVSGRGGVGLDVSGGAPIDSSGGGVGVAYDAYGRVVPAPNEWARFLSRVVVTSEEALSPIIFGGTDEQLALVTTKYKEVQQYVIDSLYPGRPILSHTIIPVGADEFTSKYSNYTFYFSTGHSIHKAFWDAHQRYGGDLRTFIFQDYDLETRQFTVMDHCGNIFVQNMYLGVL